MEQRVHSLEEQQRLQAERLAKLEANGEHLAAAASCAGKNGRKLATVGQQLKGLGRSVDGVRSALEDHVRDEAVVFRQLAEDVHVMRGAMEERQRHGEIAWPVRALLWVAGLFGYRPSKPEASS